MTDNGTVSGSLALVTDIYKGFREELLSAYGNVEFTIKDDKSQVTKLDTKVEKTLKLRLAEAFPAYGFQGEETGKSGNSDQFWLVDPIDGTSSFIRGMPNCTNMAALIIGRQPIAAVIYNFVDNELYTAMIGRGAFKNEQQIRISNRSVTESTVDNLSSTVYGQLRDILLPHGIRTLQPMGAAGRSFSFVAEGKLDGVVVINSLAAAHDRAPGTLIIQEAGGSVLSLDGSQWDIDTENYIIGTPAVVESLKANRSKLQELIKNRAS